MPDQAAQLRRLVRDAVDRHGELAPGARLVALSGAQPRLGVTTAACGLARELAQLGKRVLLVDANLTAAAVATHFDCRPAGTLADILTGARRAVEVIASPAENIRLIAGDPTAQASNSLNLDADACDRLDSELVALSRQSDIIVLDAGAGMSPWTDRLWLLAHHVLLATTAAQSAVVDAYATLKQSHHDRTAAKLQLMVLRCDAPSEAARIHEGFSDTCQRFLGQSIKPPAILPTLSSTSEAAYARSLRLLAADLACDCRAIAARVPRRAVSYQRSAISQISKVDPSG